MFYWRKMIIFVTATIIIVAMPMILLNAKTFDHCEKFKTCFGPGRMSINYIKQNNMTSHLFMFIYLINMDVTRIVELWCLWIKCVTQN